jgi:8-oxo-dGTP pyrophosphatase MutT (NUDIX family)
VHRDQLLNLLTTYSIKHPSEKKCSDQITDFVTQHDTCFNRELSIGHITGSAWIVNRAGTHTLLTHHKKLNKWLQPGGHADGESDTLQVAKREADEESGLSDLQTEDGAVFDIDVHQIPARANEAQHLHYDIRFVFRAHGSEAFVVSEESHDLAWVEINQLKNYNVDESVMRMAQKWMRRPDQAPA